LDSSPAIGKPEIAMQSGIRRAKRRSVYLPERASARGGLSATRTEPVVIDATGNLSTSSASLTRSPTSHSSTQGQYCIAAQYRTQTTTSSIIHSKRLGREG
jgi:hypothetical protein